MIADVLPPAGQRAGHQAIAAKGWLAAHRWLLLRRGCQFAVLAAFLAGPLGGIWIVKGDLNSSLTLGVLPLTDPFALLQSLVAGHVAGTTAVVGALILVGVYALIGGRMYCSFVCPVNVVTDAAHWLRERLVISKGWQPPTATRLWAVVVVLAVSAITSTVAWEFVNPITMLQRGLLFGMGLGWAVVVTVFLFDLALSRRGWCGHLCPIGAVYGMIGQYAQLRVSARRRAACDDCMDCYAVCPEPHVITPALKAGPDITPIILFRDCTNCGRCIDVCPKDVYRFAWRHDRRVDVVLPMSA